MFYLFLAKFVKLLLHRIFEIDDHGHSPSGCIYKIPNQNYFSKLPLFITTVWQTELWFMYVRTCVNVFELWRNCGCKYTGLQVESKSEKNIPKN